MNCLSKRASFVVNLMLLEQPDPARISNEESLWDYIVHFSSPEMKEEFGLDNAGQMEVEELSEIMEYFGRKTQKKAECEMCQEDLDELGNCPNGCTEDAAGYMFMQGFNRDDPEEKEE